MTMPPLPCRLVPTALVLLVMGSLWASPGFAVQPARFTHTTEADFEAGTFEGTAVTNLGDLELAAKAELLAALPAEYTVVYDVVEWNGDIYIAAGPEGAVYKLGGPYEEAPADDAGGDEEESDVDAEAEAGAADDDDAEDEAEADAAELPQRSVIEVLNLPGEQVFKLLPVDDGLAVAISGSPSRIAMLNEEEGTADTVLELPDVRYIWDVVYLNETAGALVATGPEGVVYQVELEDDGLVATALLDTPQANVLSLAASPDGDGGVSYPVYAGTDTDGIVYRLNEDGTSLPVYDAAEPEVAALVVAADGTVYAGTADADQARPGRMDGAADEDAGRPDAMPPDGEAVDVPGSNDPEDPPLEPEPAPMGEDGVATATDAEATEDAAAESEAAAEEAPADEPQTDEVVDGDPAVVTDEGDQEEAGTEASAPTPEQYDALRDEVRSRLEAARKSGKLAAGGAKGASKPKATRPRAAGKPEASAKEGNAVYRLQPDGIVTEVFRESVMVLALALDEDADRLLIATGSEGQLYEVKLAQRESAVLQDLDAEQVVTLFNGGADSGGGLILGTANPATLRTLAAGDDNATGTYTSAALDAEQVSLWGKLLVAVESADSGADSVALETRTGNVADPDAAAWSEWMPATLLNRSNNTGLMSFEVASPPARFVQYRLTLTGGDDATPVVDRVELAYVVPNLRPAITKLTAVYAETPEDPDEPTPTIVNVEWEAEDANGDRLRYEIQAQPAGEGGWLAVAEDLDDTSYEWETKTLPDGRYTVRLIAHDRLDNPKGSARAASRRSDPLVIDNTAPTVVLDGDQDDDAPAGRMIGTARDALSPIAAVEYRVAADDPWRPALPDDLIYDSTTEAFSFTMPRLASGGHVLTLRARDTRGNTRYVSRFITVP